MKPVMKMKPALFSLLLIAGISYGQNDIQEIKSKPAEPIPGQYIVILKESAARPVVKQQKKNDDREQKKNDNEPARQANIKKVKDLREKHKVKDASLLADYADVVVGFSAKLSNDEVESLKKDAEVEGVYQDYKININSEKAEPGSIVPAKSLGAAQSIPCGIFAAGGPIDGSAKSTVIWIIDTGIDTDHEDLNVQTNPTFAKSFISSEPSVEDGNGHGTHCAGIAAAKNNGVGVAGVSAGAKVVPVKVLNSLGSGEFSGVIAGLNHVAQFDITGDVVNMSLGDYPVASCATNNPALATAIVNLSNAGTFVCIAAGNDNDCSGATKSNPGCINGTRIFTVGAINCSDGKNAIKSTSFNITFSNWGSSVVDWAAVGSGVFSTFKNNSYATLNGTSMATPAVAGIVHAKGGAPTDAGTVSVCNSTYKIASTGSSELSVGASKTVTVSASDAYNLTGIFVRQGQKYTFSTSSPGWNNGSKETTCNGYDGIPVIDLPRHLDIKMMALVGEIFTMNNESSYTGSYFKIGCGPVTLTMPKTGYLVCFANDMILAYGDNSRVVTLTVKRTQ
jgi:hypothetical protein